ncbi:5'-nucleotidase C-terminal domain-containing protein [Haliea sp. E1-2-M8]|uniref:5'-nucleotidase C-terminal domain-containing protein n=1 Tax=Haliea sp. E1-2-M8 TaxID=3064706 RepID=UPI00271E5889|nr:5'-nucleotidase C-terminal domain-containing protein [Haliea sp. E1-2-M8]MDO8860558.1 5'-nucleotidase C-terminal domain-containing protein [Haliea sp. E1-2-M8]
MPAKTTTLLLLAAACLLQGCTTGAQDQSDHFELTLLHVNDHHSHLEPHSLELDVRELNLQTRAASGEQLEAVTVAYGGFPLLAGALQQLAATAPNAITLHAGDAITGTAYYSLLGGEADAALMNSICFDALVAGNHEFDGGDSGFATFIDALWNGRCKTPVLAANVAPGPGSALATGYLLPYTILERGAEQIAVIGITIGDKTRSSSRPDQGTRFLDELATAQQHIDELTGAGINKIILLTHVGLARDLALARQLSGVDVIVGGDSHSLLGGAGLTAFGLRPVAPYPSRTTNALGQPVCVVQAWEYARLLGALSVSFDSDGVVSRCSGAPVLPFAERYEYRAADGNIANLPAEDAARVTDLLRQHGVLLPVAADAGADAALAGYRAQLGNLAGTVVAHAEEDLCRDYLPGAGRSQLCPAATTWQHGGDITQLVSFSMLAATPTAAIALQNAGGVRRDIAGGSISVADVFALLPFNNTLVTQELTGSEILTVLEEALAHALASPANAGAYPYTAGLRYNVDAAREPGRRLSAVEINPRLAGSWQPLELNQRYTVVSNDFIAAGKDGYTLLGQKYDRGEYTATYTEYAQAFIDYLRDLTAQGQKLAKPPADSYSTSSYRNAAGCTYPQPPDCNTTVTPR